MKLDYGWMYDVQSADELTAIADRVIRREAQKGVMEASKLAQKKISGHATSSWGVLLQMRASVMSERDKLEFSLHDVAASIFQDVLGGMLYCLRDGGRIFVSENGAYFCATPNLRITQTCDRDTWAFPVSKIRIEQFPDGMHWYAFVGNEPVVFNGLRKFTDKDTARWAAVEWSKENAIEVER